MFISDITQCSPLAEGFSKLNENIFFREFFPHPTCGCGKCVYGTTTMEKYFMHVLADLNYANGKRAAIKVIIKL